MNKEIRMATVEFKAIDNEENKMIIEGYPITFNSPATHWGMTEIIDLKALDEADLTDVPLRYNHEEAFLILARTRNASLQLTKDNIGLKMRAELIDTTSNKDIYKSIKAGLLDKMSFAFVASEENYNFETDTRTILKIDKLYDVSVVDVPYYDSTSVNARKIDTSNQYFEEKQKEKREIEINRQIELRNRLIDQIKREELISQL